MEPSMSSIFPFNREFQKRIDPFYEKRKKADEVLVDTICLDGLLKQNDLLKIDFIKLDVHGSEFEILQGAKKTLKEVIGLLIESWVLPIHKGQKIRAHVELLAFENGFYVFEEYYRSKWKRKEGRFTKRQLVALDTLYFRDPILDNTIKDQVTAVKIICLANLFDHNSYALQLIDYFYDRGILMADLRRAMIKHMHKYNFPTLSKKLFLKFEKFLHRMSDCEFK